MTRLALVGLDSSHADHYVRLLAVEPRWPGVRLTELVDGTPARRAGLARTAGLRADGASADGVAADGVTADRASLTDVAARVDGAIVAHRAGDRHAAAVRALVAAGVPVLVDKPFATSSAEAATTLALARERGVRVTTASALRFAPEVRALRRRGGTASGATDEAPATAVEVSCPADPDGPHGGLFFLGIHGVEAARALVGAPTGTPWGPVEVEDPAEPGHPDAGTVVAATSLDGVRVRLRFVDPARPDAGFAVRVTRGDDVVHRDVALGADYLVPVVEHALRLVAPPDAGPRAAVGNDAGDDAEPDLPGGEADHRQVVDDLALLERVTARLRATGRARAGAPGPGAG